MGSVEGGCGEDGVLECCGEYCCVLAKEVGGGGIPSEGGGGVCEPNCLEEYCRVGDLDWTKG